MIVVITFEWKVAAACPPLEKNSFRRYDIILVGANNYSP